MQGEKIPIDRWSLIHGEFIRLDETTTYTRLLSVIAGGFPITFLALDRGALSFATALQIRERYPKYPNP